MGVGVTKAALNWLTQPQITPRQAGTIVSCRSFGLARASGRVSEPMLHAHHEGGRIGTALSRGWGQLRGSGVQRDAAEPNRFVRFER